MLLGDTLKNQRRKNNISQEMFAEKLGVSRQAVQKWESNRSLPNLDNIVEIAKIFNISLDELLCK